MQECEKYEKATKSMETYKNIKYTKNAKEYVKI